MLRLGSAGFEWVHVRYALGALAYRRKKNCCVVRRNRLLQVGLRVPDGDSQRKAALDFFRLVGAVLRDVRAVTVVA